MNFTVNMYMLTVPMTTLKRFLAMDDQGDVMSRSQREANKNRARKISGYAGEATREKRPYILPRFLFASRWLRDITSP